MIEKDPGPSEILADMLAEASDDAVGEWRVRIPLPPAWIPKRPSFAGSVEMARQALAAAQVAGGGVQESVTLSGLLTAVLARHENGQCGCSVVMGTDPICDYADDLAAAVAGF